MSRNQKKRGTVPGVTVYPRGKTFAYNIDIGPDPLTGDRRREYKGGFPTADEALAAAITAKSAMAEGQHVSPSRRTVAEFFTEWLATVEHEVKPSTYVNYLDYSKAYVLPIIGKRHLQEIDVPTLNRLYRHLLDSGRRKPDNNSRMFDYWQARKAKGKEPTPAQISRACNTSIHAARAAVLRYRRGRVPVKKSAGLAPKTVKNVHRMLHRALSDAVAWRYLSYNPAGHASLPRNQRRGSKSHHTWTVEQLLTWLDIARRDRDAGLWVLAATSGMRRSELAATSRESLDLENALLVIEPTRVVVAGKAEDSDGKTETSVRTISLDPFTVAALREHLVMLDQEREAFGPTYGERGLLFCHPDGRPLHPDTITRRFNRLVDQAGVPRIRLHDVRHTYATACLDAGINPKLVSDRIGHANLAVTLAIYTHRTTGQDRPAAETFARLLFGDPTAPHGPQGAGETPQGDQGDDGAAGALIPA